MCVVFPCSTLTVRVVFPCSTLIVRVVFPCSTPTLHANYTHNDVKKLLGATVSSSWLFLFIYMDKRASPVGGISLQSGKISVGRMKISHVNTH